MKGITTCQDCLIELWKTDCPDCEKAVPIVETLEQEGYEFEKYNIESPKGGKLWEEYTAEIDENSKKQGYEEGYIYTPTFINRKTREVMAFSNRPPTKEELIKLAEERR